MCFDNLDIKFLPTIKQLRNDIKYQHFNEDREIMKNLFGPCLIEIRIKGIIKLIMIELSDPFYIFQLFSIILWLFFEAYYMYSCVIILSSVLSLGLGVYEVRSNLNEIKNIAEYNVKIKRIKCILKEKDIHDSKFEIEEIYSYELIPGDLIILPDEGINLPCDCILLEGNAVVNESILTGESIPVIKYDIDEIPNTQLDFHFDVDSNNSFYKHVIFTGTKLVQKKINSYAVVYKTGFDSEKGNLIRAILNPTDQEDDFKKESEKYISGMFIFVIIVFLIVLPYIINDKISKIIILFCDMLTTGVPPALPACLGVGIAMAVERLKKGKIICIKRDKINMAGQVTCCIFDKTGTLTEDHLEEYGEIIVKSGNKSLFELKEIKIYKSDEKNENLSSSVTKFEMLEYFSGIKEYLSNLNIKNYNDLILRLNLTNEISVPNLDFEYLKQELFTTCHTLTFIDNKILGDPIDEQMYKQSGWSNYNTEDKLSTFKENFISIYKNPYINNFFVGVVKTFPFYSKLQRMSVITKYISDENISKYKIFTKGAPEKIKLLCKSESLPNNYNEILNLYSSKGLRILSMAYKLIEVENVNSKEIINIQREEAESNLIFLGFYLVQNKLKKETKEEIVTLKDSELKIFMATGDNIMTACFIAQECGISNTDITSLELSNDGNINVNEFTNCFKNIKDINKTNVDIDEENELETEGNYCSLGNRNKQNSDENNDCNLGESKKEFLENDLDKSMCSNIENEISLVKDNEKVNNSNGDCNLFFSNIKKINVLLGSSSKLQINENNLNKIVSEEKLTNSVSFNEKIQKVAEFVYNLNLNKKYAVDGNLLEVLLVLNNSDKTDSCIKNIIKDFLHYSCSVYARMTPDHKALIVKEMRKNNIVLMCGDGANDCPALKASNVGLSLSQEEASIAAPFTSKIPNISTVKKLLREGKASLVTSFQSFKYMMMYSIIILISITMLMTSKTYLSDNQFLIVDLFLIIPFSILIARTGAYKKLNKFKPTTSLFSKEVLISLFLQTLISVSFLFLGYYYIYIQDWYIEDLPLSKTEDVVPGYKNTVG